MSPRLKSFLLKYGITTLVSGLLIFRLVSSRDVASLTGADKYKVLSDGFFIIGVMLLAFGLMFLISNEGGFDGLIWGVNYAIKTLVPFGRLKKQETFAEYKEKRKDQKIKGYSFIVIIGAIEVGIAVIFTMLFHEV